MASSKVARKGAKCHFVTLDDTEGEEDEKNHEALLLELGDATSPGIE